MKTYADKLDKTDFVKKLEKTNLGKLLDAYEQVMSSIRVEIIEKEELPSKVDSAPILPQKPETQLMWTIDTTVHQKKADASEKTLA